MNHGTPGPRPPNILIVDDTPANLRLLVEMLRDRGYKARPVPSGKLALEAVQASLPDLILLDITMPELDGYGVLQRLKADAATRDVPVIFISALGETADKVRGFQAGGVDYITKPFQFEEVEARVSAHLELQRQRQELRQQYQQVRELERRRDELTHMIVHDLRSPLAALRMALDLLGESPGSATVNTEQVVRVARQSVENLIGLVNQVLDVSRLESGRLELHRSEFELSPLVHEVVRCHRFLSQAREIRVDMPDALAVYADAELLRRVLENLLGNAIKFTSQTGTIEIQARWVDGVFRITVGDDGPGIPADKQAAIFEKYSQLDPGHRRHGSGLGLTFAKMAVEAHGGTIGVTPRLPRGSTFWFELPTGAPR